MVKIYINESEKKVSKARVFSAPYQERKETDYAVIKERANVIKLVFDIDIEDVVIRPKRYNISYKIENSNTVLIYPDNRYNFSVEPDGNIENAVLIFNKVSEELCRDDYENIMYFDKGRHFVNEVEIVDDNTLVYVDDGATVDGRFIANNIKNIGFDGYGVITLENYDFRTRIITVNQCENIKIRNLIFKDSTNWNVYLNESKNIEIDNIKILGCFGNSDGIDVCTCENVSVKNCFIRTWDDCLVVKGLGNGSCRNLHYSDCVLWNDFARPMEIGVETRADEICNVVFESIDVIHSVTRYPVMGIHHGDRAKIHDIVFKNIIVEDTPGAQPFDVRITHSAWNGNEGIGNIRSVLFKDITFLEEKTDNILSYHSRIQGHSEESDISGVVFENIKFGSKTADSIESLGLEVFDYASDIEVRMTEGERREPVLTSINATEGKYEKGYYTADVEVTFENKYDSIKEGVCKLVVSPQGRAEYYEDIHYSIEPKEIKAIKRSVKIPAGRYAFSIAGSNVDIQSSFAFLNLDLKLTDKFEDCPVYYFDDSYGNRLYSGIQFAMEHGCLKIKSELLKKYDLMLYASELSDEEIGEMLFSTENSNSGYAPALTKGADGGCVEAPQIGCPEEIAFVFKNYPKVQINSTKLRKRIGDTAFVPLKSIGIETGKPFRLELVVNGFNNKRYDYTLFGSPVPKETIRDPRVMAHMFVHVACK